MLPPFFDCFLHYLLAILAPQPAHFSLFKPYCSKRRSRQAMTPLRHYFTFLNIETIPTATGRTGNTSLLDSTYHSHLPNARTSFTYPKGHPPAPSLYTHSHHQHHPCIQAPMISVCACVGLRHSHAFVLVFFSGVSLVS